MQRLLPFRLTEKFYFIFIVTVQSNDVVDALLNCFLLFTIRIFKIEIFKFKIYLFFLSDASHFLKVELPDYIDIDHEPEPNPTKQTISMTDPSSEQEKTLTKYKQMEDDNEIELIYQDSESDQRDHSEIGEFTEPT